MFRHQVYYWSPGMSEFVPNLVFLVGVFWDKCCSFCQGVIIGGHSLPLHLALRNIIPTNLFEIFIFFWSTKFCSEITLFECDTMTGSPGKPSSPAIQGGRRGEVMFQGVSAANQSVSPVNQSVSPVNQSSQSVNQPVSKSVSPVSQVDQSARQSSQSLSQTSQ